MEIDLLSVLGAGGWGLLAGWVLPAALAVVGVAYGILPSTGIHHDFTKHLSVIEQVVVLAIAAFALGVLLNTIQLPLYRVIEGYSLPDWFKRWRRKHHIKRRNNLRQEAEHARGEKKGRLIERLRRYPKEDNQILATRFGNATRAFEGYGWNRYRLDSITTWSELYSLVPDALRSELDRARAPVDFCVAAFYLSTLIGLGFVPLAFVHTNGVWLAGTAGAMLLALVWYRVAIGAIGYWYVTNQAMVNLGRLPLASALGLNVPPSLAEERNMWSTVMALVQEGYTATSARELQQYRTDGPVGDEAPEAPGLSARSLDFLLGAGIGVGAGLILRVIVRRLLLRP